MKDKKFLRAIVFSAVALFVSCNEQNDFSIWEDEETIVGVQPFGNINEAEVDSVSEAIKRMYGFEVLVYDHIPIPANAYTEIRYPRYRGDTLVEWISNHVPDSVDMLIGLTNQDISITKYEDAGRTDVKDPEWQYNDFGIFGLGRVGGNACVVSSNRLRKNVGDELFYKRLTRISCHEVGHVLGLSHCPKPNCLMNDANESIKTIDKSTGDLCKSCWDEIH